jgi:histidinol-phosphate phosphatase family protein
LKTNRAVFFDRDGVINKKRDDYVKNWNEFELLDNVIDSLKLLSKANCKIIIVTNQSVINRKIITKDILQEIHDKMIDEFDKSDIKIDAIFYCPHIPEENCNCRKPKTGLLEKAILEFDLIPEKCILVGDSNSDIQAGNAIGAKTYLLKDGMNILNLTKTILKNDFGFTFDYKL